MYSAYHLALKYFRYYVKASNGKGHGMHSPFVYQCIQFILNNKNNYTAPQELSELRKQLLSNQNKIQVADFGAGSRTTSSNERKISQIARSALKPQKYSEILYRMVHHYHCSNILELGTSLGVTTIYLSKANPNAKVITIEGSNAVAEIAERNFGTYNCNNIKLVRGHFDSVLPNALEEFQSIDLAFIDGNHQYQPTINYFHKLLKKSDNDTILIFDDIHWSSGMEKAWEEIKAHESVRTTIDLFFMGLVLFRKEFLEKQHFQIRY
jgi:Predicted O-methyltransferase